MQFELFVVDVLVKLNQPTTTAADNRFKELLVQVETRVTYAHHKVCLTRPKMRDANKSALPTNSLAKHGSSHLPSPAVLRAEESIM